MQDPKWTVLHYFLLALQYYTALYYCWRTTSTYSAVGSLKSSLTCLHSSGKLLQDCEENQLNRDEDKREQVPNAVLSKEHQE